jgi:hypothetical protein
LLENSAIEKIERQYKRRSVTHALALTVAHGYNAKFLALLARVAWSMSNRRQRSSCECGTRSVAGR